MAWGCAKQWSDICGTGKGSGGGGSGGCLVPLLCPKDPDWGLGGGWSPAGKPSPGGPSPPPVDPSEDNKSHSSDESTKTSHSTSEKSTTEKTTSTEKSSTRTKTSTASSASSSESKFHLCMSVHEGSQSVTSAEPATSTTQPQTTSKTATSTSSRATSSSASKVRLCLSVHDGSAEATSAHEATGTSGSGHSGGDGGSHEKTTGSTPQPTSKTHSHHAPATSKPSTFSTSTKSSDTTTSADTTTEKHTTTHTTESYTMPTPWVKSDYSHRTTSCDSATLSYKTDNGAVQTNAACAGKKYESPLNGVIFALNSAGMSTDWAAYFVKHDEQGKKEEPKWCDSKTLDTWEASGKYAVKKPPFPDGTFKIGDNMPDGNPQDCEYKGDSDKAGKLSCWGKDFSCEEYRLDDKTKVCYDTVAKTIGPKVYCGFPDENGKLVEA